MIRFWKDATPLLLLVGVVFSIILGTRVLLHQFTQGFHEYEAMFLYIGDIVIVFSMFLYFRKSIFFISKPVLMLLGIILGSALLSVFFAPLPGLSLYYLLRLLLLIFFAFICSLFFVEEKGKKYAFGALVVGGVIESLLALIQFKLQHAIGLSLFGEPPISVLEPASSRILTGGVYTLRAYGTFLHPNVLGAFLILSFAAVLYFWFSVTIPKLQVTRNNWKKMFVQYRPILYSNIILSLSLFLICMGIALTFSRSAWVVGSLLLVVPLFGLYVSQYRKQALKFFVVFTASIAMVFFLFSPWIISRTESVVGDRSLNERLIYMKVSQDIILQQPLGIGLGNQVFYGVKNGLYARYGAPEAWKWQPVHNIYLLIASEIGVVGGVSFLLLLTFLFYKILRTPFNIYTILLCALFGVFMIFGLLDHFLWDLWQGQLMFWLVIALVFARLRT